jgi:paraquat-inducible protein A
MTSPEQVLPASDVSLELLACHDCDALFQVRDLQAGESVICPHCAAKLGTHQPNAVHRAAAFAVSAAIFFFVANIFPFIELKAGGQVNVIALGESVSALASHGSPWLAVAVAVFILGAPLLMIGGMLYLLVPLLGDRRLPGAAWVCRAVYGTDTWNMIEVFLVGVLVSLLKLNDIATVTLGISFWAFTGLIICLAGSVSAIERRELWHRLEAAQAS